MPIARIGEHGMNYWMGRDSSSKRKEAVLFVHGAGGGLFSWSYQKAFFEKEFKPIMIELPGHGASGGKGEEEIERYADHVYSFLKALGLPRVILVGHSMGGAIAQTLALNHREALKGVVLVGTGAKLKVFPDVLNGIKTNFEETVRKITRFAYSPRAPSDLIGAGIEQLLRCRPEVLYGDFLACDRFNRMDEVAGIDLPALILCGDEDEMTPVKYSQFLQSRIKGSKIEIIPHAGHMVMMESPGAFNEKVREFIGKGFAGAI